MRAAPAKPPMAPAKPTAPARLGVSGRSAVTVRTYSQPVRSGLFGAEPLAPRRDVLVRDLAEEHRRYLERPAGRHERERPDIVTRRPQRGGAAVRRLEGPEAAQPCAGGRDEGLRDETEQVDEVHGGTERQCRPLRVLPDLRPRRLRLEIRVRGTPHGAERLGSLAELHGLEV